MYPAQQMLVKEMVREREALAEAKATTKRLYRMSYKPEPKPASPVKKAWGMLVRNLKQAHAG